MEIYSIQEWLFKTANGKFEFDLAESGIQFQTVNDITIKDDWILDYSIDQGNIELRELIARNYKNTTTRNIAVAHGGQEALYLLYRTLLEAGDHVITVTPGWQQSWEVPKAIGANVTLLNWIPGDKFPLEEFEKKINQNTKLIILNSPSNPIGSMIQPEEWSTIVSLARNNNSYIVNDEEYIINFQESIRSVYEKSFSVSSLSKIFGMPALRIGWIAGPEDIINKIINYKRYTSVCNSLLCEKIAIEVLKNSELHINRYNRIIKNSYPLLKEFVIKNHKYVSLVESKNTPFAWLNLNTDISSFEFCKRLLDEHKMLVMPAEVFGYEKGIRVTYGRDVKTLKEGFTRLELLFSNLDLEA
ncbi:MAG: aminotransferase class I/II-fold pyridoxal phosphate-dependent enzyme [Acinetobacter venetianus]|uniref:aminotransferase class I/II-fold pyridoxal phosphate-dependent enzyme n=1 Tax=Acinetobacter venetianus TaxID=52133 RepID=UPI0035BE4C02